MVKVYFLDDGYGGEVYMSEADKRTPDFNKYIKVGDFEKLKAITDQMLEDMQGEGMHTTYIEIILKELARGDQ